MPDELAFHEAMIDIYRRADREANYRATRFIQMVSEQGGLATARYLLGGDRPSDGYTALWQKGRLDLTVERLVLEPSWQPLFTHAELQTAQSRLREYGFSEALPEIAVAAAE